MPEQPIAQTPQPLQVLYFQSECLVVNKPGGLPTQAPPGIPSLEAQVRRYWAEMAVPESAPEPTDAPPLNTSHPPSIPPIDSLATANALSQVYVGLPHRLDRATSGAVLLGQTKQVTRKLAAQFERRTIKKIYWVIVEGQVVDPQGNWSDWMKKLPDQPLSSITTQDDPAAQWAELEYRTLATAPDCSLLEIALKTGRTHQIRLQLSSRGFPILGDLWYGARRDFGNVTADQRQRIIALHARLLDFWHPRLHQPVAVTAPLPDPWTDFLRAQNWAL